MARPKDFEPLDVIEDAIDVFLHKGYEATAVKDIVDASHVHPGSLYNAFGNKKELYKQSLEHFASISKFNQTLSGAETAPPRATIEKLFFDLIEATDQRGAVGHCLVSNATMELGGVDEDITLWLKQVFAKSEDLMCRLIERGQSAGEITSKQAPRELAQFLANTVQGMQLMSRLERDREKLHAIANTALAALD